MAWRSGVAVYAFFLILAVIPSVKSIPETSPVDGDLILDAELTSEKEDADQPFVYSTSYEDFPEDNDGQAGRDETDQTGSSGWSDDVERLMRLLRASAMALARARSAWRSRDQQQRERSKKREPFNSFVRIGRAGTTSPATQGDVTALRLVQLLLGDATQAQGVSGAFEDDDLKAGSQSLLPADGAEIGRGKRWSFPRHHFVRIGRNGGGQRSDAASWRPSYGQQVLGRFLPPARNGYGDVERGDDILLSRRASFVRIGRLPSSVFHVPNIPSGGREEEADDSLEGRRSPGYRLTQSGFVRGGRRKRGTLNDFMKALVTSQRDT